MTFKELKTELIKMKMQGKQISLCIKDSKQKKLIFDVYIEKSHNPADNSLCERIKFILSKNENIFSSIEEYEVKTINFKENQYIIETKIGIYIIDFN